MDNTLIDRIVGVFSRAAMPIVSCALAMAIAFIPGTALAGADEEGDLDAPNAAAGGTSAQSAQEDTAIDDAVNIAADGKSASVEGSPFALEDFSRSQVGSNSDVNGVYAGYRYFVSDESGSLAVVATDELTVVHVPSETAQAVGFDAESSESRGFLKQLLVALDAQNSKGGATLSAEGEWAFTGEPEFERDGVVYKFDQELKPGEFYVCVVGADGSDVTQASYPSYVRLTHADFATLASADQVSVIGAPEGFEALASFLKGIDYSPLWVTLKTTLTAIVFIFVLGLLAAYFSLRIPARAQDIADSIFTIPMVLPPTVCGFLLLLAFGKNTAVGQWFIDIGFPLIFSWQATVLAAVVVAFPLMYRSARGAFENLDPNMLDAARTLGWSNAKIFFKLMLPLSWSSIAAGTVLSFARALGEFGATLFLAGVKLSGCKNATAAVRAGERSVRLPKWGIEAATSAAVPEDVKALGVRAFFLQRVDGPGENCYRVRVDRVSDSRFERTVLLGFLDRDESEAPTVSRTDDEMKYLHQHLFWRVDKLAVPVDELPHEGEELWIRIPPDKVYLVSR